MPATCPALIHQFSLLLLVGLHLFVGSFPLGSPSSSSSTPERSPFTTESPSPQEESSAAALPLRLRGEKQESGELRAAFRGTWDHPATEGRTSSGSSPAIMSNQKPAESSDIKTRTSSSHTDSMDAFRTFGSDEEWTLQTVTNSTSASAIGTVNAASYTEILRAGDLAQLLTSGMQTERDDVSPSTVDTAELETVTLSVHFSEMPVPLLPEDNQLATGSSYQTDTQGTDNLKSRIHIKSTDSSATVKSGAERTFPFLTDDVTLTSLEREGPVSQRELSTQAPSSATHSKGRRSTSEVVHFPDSSDRIVLTQSYLSPKTTAEDIGHQQWNTSDTERNTSSFYEDSTYVSGLSGKGEQTEHISRDASRTLSSSKISTVPSNEISITSRLTDPFYLVSPVQTQQEDLSVGDSDLTEAALTHSQTLLETTALEDGDHQTWSSSSTERWFSYSSTDSVAGSGLSARNGGRTLRTLRDVSSSHSATQIFTDSDNEISSTPDLSESSSVLTPVHTRQMNLSPGYIDFSEVAFRHAQVPLETTGVENGDHQPWRNSNTESSIFSSQTDSISVSVPSVRSRGRTLQTLRNISSFVNATEIPTTSNNEISRTSGLPGSILIPLKTVPRNLMAGDTEFPETTLTHSHTSSEIPVTEDNGNQQTSSSNTARSLSSFLTESEPVPVLLGSDRESTVQTRVINISSFPNATEMSVTSNTEISSNSDLSYSSHVLTSIQTRQTSLSLEDTDFTERVPIYSQVSLETTGDRHDSHILSNFDIGNRATETESTFPTATLVTDGESTIQFLSNRSKSTSGTEFSVFDLADITSSDLSQLSPATAQSEAETVPSTEMDFVESSENSDYSTSTTDLSRTGTHLQLVNMSSAEQRVSSAFTDSVYLSTTIMHSGGRTLRSLQDNSTSPDSLDNSTYNTESSQYLDPTLTLTAMAEVENHMSFSEEQFTTPSIENSLKHSSVVPIYFSTPQDSSTVGNDHNSVNGSSITHSYTENIYSSSSFSNREAQTVHSPTDATFAEVVESTSSYEEKTNSTELGPILEMYSRRSGYSVRDFDTTEPSTEILQSFSSSRIPTYTSFQSEHSDTGTDYQPMNSTDTGKRSSSSQTDSMYISTTFTRGGERTLLSIPNHSTSAHSSESSTFLAETLSSSESVEVPFSVTQSKESNTSSSGVAASAMSTEPLAVHSLKTSGYASTVNEPHTTQFYLKSESTSTGSLSFSSLATTKQESLIPTQLPTLVSSSGSYFPSSSSDFPSPFSPSPEILLTTFSPRLSSVPLPSLSVTPPSLSPNETFETSFSVSATEVATEIDQSTAKSSHTEFSSQTYLLKKSTDVRSTEPPPLLSDTTEHLTNRSSTGTLFQMETKSSEIQDLSLPGSSVEKTAPVLTTSPMHLLESTLVSDQGKTTASPLSDASTPKEAFSQAEATSEKGLAKTAHTTPELPIFTTNTGYLVTSKPQKDHASPPPSTKIPFYTVGISTKKVEASRATTVKGTNPSITTTHLPIFSSSKTTVGHFPTLPVPAKPTLVPWVRSPKTSPTSHGKDVDECLSNPCPAMATCSNTQGSFQCICSLGYQMEKGKCSLVRTFVGQFPLPFNTTEGKYSELHQVEEDITNILNSSLSTLPGYYTSVVKATRQSGTIQVFVQSTFSLLSNVTYLDIFNTILSHIRACQAPSETCHFLSKLTLLHRVGGLCKHKDPKCDKETSVCVDSDGIAVCQCKPGYFKYNKLDHSCRACEDGYKLQNDTCVRCPFGLGGFNCGNPYQLITIVIAAAGGGLLLIMGIALIVTCCQKNKNDISKLIFKSGDFQMSPYAEYPKNPRVQDWGRESIEMQENGSTKNLLQMTDVYCMPSNLRNPELERNGLYPPYTGLPGSRHSCIYPGQYNPSFISDDSRRRDYF